MRLARLGLAAALCAMLALPVMAQSTSTSPKAVPTSAGGPGGKPGAAHGAAPGTKPPSGATQSKLIDINTASKDELDALPGIGSARAEAIIKNRPYRAKDELVDKKVIPKDVYEGIKDKVVARQK